MVLCVYFPSLSWFPLGHILATCGPLIRSVLFGAVTGLRTSVPLPLSDRLGLLAPFPL